MIYLLLRKILFSFSPERSHTLTLKLLKFFHRFHLLSPFIKVKKFPCEVMALSFPNPIGLAAGLDKNGDYIDALAALGFGFIEVGTITLKPQVGNPKPRLFRSVQDQAIINRMGFNNKGVEYLIEQLKKTKYTGILGINIGKNKDTSLENAIEEYVTLYRRVLPYASYVTVNVSSPNTEGLRSLQQADKMQELLHALKQVQSEFYVTHQKYIPLVIKIAPDLTAEEIQHLARVFLAEKIDGVIATNTTLSRDNLHDSNFSKEQGGLSGLPLTQRASNVLVHLKDILGDKIAVIGCGGVMTGNQAAEKIKMGASLIQLYSGLIYQGPQLISVACEVAASNMTRNGMIKD